MANIKIPGEVEPDEYHWAYGLSEKAQKEVLDIIHKDMDEQINERTWDLLMSYSSSSTGCPEFWITLDSPDGGFNFTINNETNNDLDWFVNMVMEAINDEGLHYQYSNFLSQTAQAFGFLSLAATKQLEQLKSEPNG